MTSYSHKPELGMKSKSKWEIKRKLEKMRTIGFGGENCEKSMIQCQKCKAWMHYLCASTGKI